MGGSIGRSHLNHKICAPPVRPGRQRAFGRMNEFLKGDVLEEDKLILLTHPTFTVIPHPHPHPPTPPPAAQVTSAWHALNESDHPLEDFGEDYLCLLSTVFRRLVTLSHPYFMARGVRGRLCRG